MVCETLRPASGARCAYFTLKWIGLSRPGYYYFSEARTLSRLHSRTTCTSSSRAIRI